MFQVMMNDLLRDMIKTVKVVVFIDDVMIAIETECYKMRVQTDFG